MAHMAAHEAWGCGSCDAITEQSRFEETLAAPQVLSERLRLGATTAEWWIGEGFCRETAESSPAQPAAEQCPHDCQNEDTLAVPAENGQRKGNIQATLLVPATQMQQSLDLKDHSADRVGGQKDTSAKK